MFRKKILLVFVGALTLGLTSCSDSDDSSKEDEGVLIKGTGEKFKHRVVAEDFTGTWCVYCPRVSYAIDALEEQEGDKFVAVALHRGIVTPASHQNHDPWNFPSAQILESELNVTGYPTAYVNRDKKWKGPENNNVTYPLDFYKTTSSVGIKIESTLSASNGSVKISLKFGEDVKEQLSYVVYVQEDGVVYRQANATTLYGNTSGTPRWEMSFVHNNIVRAGSDIMGTDIETSKVSNSEFTENLDFSYESENIEQLEVTVLVLDSDGKIINARTVNGNTTADYEKL